LISTSPHTTQRVAAILGRRMQQKANEVVLLKANFFQIKNQKSSFNNAV
jgi:hypothetical protein